MKFRPFAEAREFVHKLGLKNQSEWHKYCKSGNKPEDIPAYPDAVYKQYWKGYGDWLGTNYVAHQNRKYRSFKEAREFVHSLGLKNSKQWQEYVKSGKKPEDIPADIHGVYKKEFRGIGDWLGTGFIPPKDIEHRPFEKAREFVHTLKLESWEEWSKYRRSGNKPSDIPSDPAKTYLKEWKDWGDWLGHGGEHWSARKLKELLRDLIDSKIIYQWDEAVLYSLLLRRGLLDLHSQHKQFFKNLIEASRIDEGRKAIEEYANSDSDNPPDLSKLAPLNKQIEDSQEQEQEQEIESASSQELSNIVEGTDPLDYGEIKTAKQILAQTTVLESINVDEEAMQFYIDYSIDELWKSAFRDKENTALAVKREGKNANKYHDTVVDTFLSDYEGTQNIKIPKGYAFPYSPTLMQLYVAYKVKTNQYFGNFSGTGAGKTLSAVLASRVIDCKLTLIICPNDVVEQWKKSILEIFPDSNVTTGKEAFYAKYDENKYQYLVLNYDKFSQEESPNLILILAKQKVDFVVLDEIHFVKKRDEESSQRRKNLDVGPLVCRKSH